MQKRWKMLVTLVLALMMIMTSVFAEGVDGAGNTAGSGDTPPKTETQAPTASPAPVVTEAPTAAPTEKPTAAPTEKPTAAPTEKPTAAPTEKPTDAPTEKPAETPTQKPTNKPTNKPTATPAPSVPPTNAGTDGSDTPDDTVQIDPNGAAEAEGGEQHAEPVVPATNGRATWVVMNVNLRNLSDERADATMKMAKFLLARAVADGYPVGLYMMRPSSKVYEDTVSSPEEWDALMAELADISFSSKELPTKQIEDFMASINKRTIDLSNVDLWMLSSNSKVGSTGFNRKGDIKTVLNESGAYTHFVRFQKRDEMLGDKDEWLDEKILDLGVTNFEVEPLYYDEVAEEPIVKAMEVFGLNLLSPYTDRKSRTDDDGAIVWQHAGMDTLLILGTEGGGVSVEAVAVKGQDRAFPIVIEISSKQYMVLLRNVSPGTYKIKPEGSVISLQAAYNIQDAALTLEEPSETWYLERQELTVSLNLPQVQAEDISLYVYINGQQVPEKTEEQDGVVITVEGSDPNGIRWHVSVPRQAVGPGAISFVAKTGAEIVDEFVVTSPDYNYIVVDRALTLRDADGREDFAYYYNVPGLENQPVSIGLAQFFHNPDEQPLIYTVDSDEFVIENDTLTYNLQGEAAYREWILQVKDTEPAHPLSFIIGMKHVDFLAEVETWQAEMAQNAYEGELGQDTFISFTLPAETAQFYDAVCKQYPQLPAELMDALYVVAVVKDSAVPEGYELPVQLKEEVDGGITGDLQVPAYNTKEDQITVTFRVMILGQVIAEQQIVPACTITVSNDSPTLAEGVPATLTLKAGIQGAPGKRVPLDFDAINAAQKDGTEKLPTAIFVPEQLFTDLVHLDGLTVTIKAEPASLVQLVCVAEDGQTEEEIASQDGVWVLDPHASVKSYKLLILDKGKVTLEISANDGENEGTEQIHWEFAVSSPFDITVLIVIIAAAVLLIAVIVLLILRQVRKPSFARMNSTMNMRVCTPYSPNGSFATVPMGIYGKKETDMAHLVIACQQPMVATMPIDVLADVEIHPGKRHTYRLVLGKRAEHLNVVVGDQAQNAQKPVPFGEEQMVRIYADLNEMIFLQITSDR